MIGARTLAVGLAATALLVSCGSDDPTALYRLEPTRECLEQSDLRVSTKPPATDFVASTASGGALRVRFADIRLTLVFGESEEAAGRIDQAYRRFAPRKLPIDDVLKRNRNVVQLWEFSPTIDHQDTLNRCLRS
jgi:hypothetical protein